MNQHVIVKGSGGAGLGDRICGLAVGILYARHSGRVLHVDWRDRAFQSHEKNLFPQLLKVEGVEVSEKIPDSVDVAPDIWTGHLDLEIDQLRSIDLKERGITWSGAAPPWDREEAVARYSIDVTKLDYSEPVVVVWSGASMDPLVKSLQQSGREDPRLSAHDMLGRVISQSISFHDEIVESVQSFREAEIARAKLLGVHYRKTDEAAVARTIPTEAQYLSATGSSVV